MDVYAFLPTKTIYNRLLKSPFSVHSTVYRSLVVQRGHQPSKVSHLLKEYSSAKRERKIELLEEAAKELRGHVKQYERHSTHQIVCDEIAKKVIDKWYRTIFGHDDEENKLYDPLRKMLRKMCDEVEPTYDKTRLGYPDFFAFKKKRLWAVDAKTTYDQYKRFLVQASKFKRYSDYVYLAATPGLVVEIGEKEMESGAQGMPILERNLKDNGIGMIIVDLTSRKSAKIDAPRNKIGDNEKRELMLKELGWK